MYHPESGRDVAVGHSSDDVQFRGIPLVSSTYAQRGCGFETAKMIECVELGNETRGELGASLHRNHSGNPSRLAEGLLAFED